MHANLNPQKRKKRLKAHQALLKTALKPNSFLRLSLSLNLSFKAKSKVKVKLVLKVAQNMKMFKSRTFMLMWHIGWYCIW